MKVAKYRNLKYGYESIEEDGWKEESSSYIRTTEFVEVDFVELAAEKVIPQEIAHLKKQKQEEREKLAVILNGLDEKIAKLSAITHQPENQEPELYEPCLLVDEDGCEPESL